jgi:tellurite resistance protein TerC
MEIQSIGTPALWIGFSVVVFFVLAIDLYVGSKNHGPMTKQAALRWTVLWVSCAAAFASAIAILDTSPNNASVTEFINCYIVEYGLSVDNLFIFMLLFSTFKVPQEHQHRVLFWGIFGAIVLRAIFIFVGTALLAKWHFLIYFFGAFLIYTGVKLIVPHSDDEEEDISKNLVVRLAKRFVRVHDHYDGNRFFTVHNGVRMATPLFLVLVCVELSDVVFALDSIPAVFGMSSDPFIIYTSNIFAILGLRSLYFLLAGALWGLRFLQLALGFILAFVGVKMCLPIIAVGLGKVGVIAPWGDHPISPSASLAVVAGLLITGIGASMLFPGKKPAADAGESVDERKG